MARGKIFMRFPGQKESQVWQTNLKGHGRVHVGEEFVAIQTDFLGNKVEKGGRKLLVRVVEVTSKAIGNADLIDVEILQDLTPEKTESKKLF